MRKGMIISGVVVVILLITFGSAYFWYNSNYGTQDYYTQIVDKDTKFVEKDDSNRSYVNYAYHQPAYNQAGQKITVKFNGNLERPLKLHAYLKIGYNAKRNQVISWSKVDKKDVPKAALKQINP
ncbi:YxeA family protein [Pediococcus pentosaceus]|uniref:YxeA family protein n=1 Tax=Pediococcus pentosaceus TaxID=1255 RepID=A0AB73HG01_PEDPE|nr:YxeA family protein [Pediococcus pentosaceus]KAF0467335.1 YxeA family protein [Pediococcus pentosaceus]MBF7115397.1 YxeA family protein [Pediococcus pentosaceus]MCM6793677.1 YxeA family protein [Pediococcus pentosaceus]MCM6810980.1 YxeA family protein [Pediococcus pentosaceus]MCM6812618.1 YxeA family protein [Pediococcus pentosaceus]